MARMLLPLCFFTLLLIEKNLAQPAAPENKISMTDLQEHTMPNHVRRYFKDRKPFTGNTYDRYEANETILVYEIENGYIQMQKGWKFNGTVERVFHFKNGLPHGKLTMYYNNGQKYFEENYVEGLQHGKQYGWYADGSLRLEQDFINGTEIMKKNYPKPAAEN